MAPSPNVERRRVLADAAIEILGRSGLHGLSHRAVDLCAQTPPGTTSNYFRSRDALLLAAAERVMELHRDEMAAAGRHVRPGRIDRDGLVELIAGSLYHSATAQRLRYLAIYELTMEATRRPELHAALGGMEDRMAEFTVLQHRALGLDTTPGQVRALITLFGGALFGLVTGMRGEPDEQAVRELARAVVTGALG